MHLPTQTETLILHDQAASRNDHVEPHITSNQGEMERPHNGRDAAPPPFRRTGSSRKFSDSGRSRQLYRSDASGIACEPKQGCHALYCQAPTIDDQMEFYVASDKRQMKGPDDSRGAERYQEQAEE